MQKFSFKSFLLCIILLALSLPIFANSLMASQPSELVSQSSDTDIACTVYLPMVANSFSNPYPALSPPIEAEPNNSTAEANGFLKPNVTYTGLPNDLHDAFKFHAPSGGQLTIDVSAHTGEDVTIVLYNSITERLGFENLPASGSGSFTFDLDSSGVYIIDLVTINNHNSSQAYQLSYRLDSRRSASTHTPQALTSVNCKPNTWIEENFDSNTIDTDIWDILECSGDELSGVTSGALKFKLGSNDSTDWESCSILPVIFDRNAYKIEADVTILDGNRSTSSSDGFVGIFASCGDAWINLTLSAEGTVASSINRDPTSIVIESFEDIDFPIDRNLQMVWTGTKVKFASLDGSILKGHYEMPCTASPNYFLFGAGTNPGGYIEGTIDNLVVTERSDLSTPTPMPAVNYKHLRTLDEWYSFGDTESFDVTQMISEITFNYKTPKDGNSSYIGFGPNSELKPFSGVSILTRTIRSGTRWDVIYFGTGWDTDGDIADFDEDYYVTFGYSQFLTFVDIYNTGKDTPPLQFTFPPPDDPLGPQKLLQVENIAGVLHFYIDDELLTTWDFPLENNENAYGQSIQLEAYIEEVEGNDLSGFWRFLRYQPYTP